MPKIQDVIKFPGYKISDDGIAFGLNGKILKQCSDKRGYKRVWMYKDGKRVEKYIHRLVAENFVLGDTGLTVNHIDGNKLNNNFYNLEWIFNSDNVKHSYAIGLRKKENMGNKRGKSFAIDIDSLNVACNLIKNGMSTRSVAKMLNLGRSTLQYQYNKNFKSLI